MNIQSITILLGYQRLPSHVQWSRISSLFFQRALLSREKTGSKKTSAWSSTWINDPHDLPTSFDSPFLTWLPTVLTYPWQKFCHFVLLLRSLQEILGQLYRPHLVVFCQLIACFTLKDYLLPSASPYSLLYASKWLSWSHDLHLPWLPLNSQY